ncbi:MAG: DoxX family protein [Abitibacteriaceae bacterium]|nr:DoxX family protein [Abditibacteriaceae bacterium]MBV9866201.1 DoxX family protein [Abditibacteriaceae bacterium]
MQQFYGDFLKGPAAVGLLILRLVTGGALMQHGWPKIQNPFHWMDVMSKAHPTPSIFQALGAFAEFGGGLALILGLLTPIAAFGIVCNMAVALMKVHLPHGDPWVAGPGAKGGSYEPALGYLAVALMLLLTGPGAFSIDAQLFRKKRPSFRR